MLHLLTTCNAAFRQLKFGAPLILRQAQDRQGATCFSRRNRAPRGNRYGTACRLLKQGAPLAAPHEDVRGATCFSRRNGVPGQPLWNRMSPAEAGRSPCGTAFRQLKFGAPLTTPQAGTEDCAPSKVNAMNSVSYFGSVFIGPSVDNFSRLEGSTNHTKGRCRMRPAFKNLFREWSTALT